MSYVLTGGLVARSLGGPLEETDLATSGDRIGGREEGAQRVDVSGCVVVPGLACAHHHLYSSLARGMPGPPRAPRDFMEILRLIWWRLDRALGYDSIELSALTGAVEAARCGTTSLIDHHASPAAIDGSLDAVADALRDAGVRGAVCYEVTDRHGESGGRAGVAENARFLQANARPLVRSMMGAHASFTIGPATMDHMVSTTRDLGVPLHIHLAEDAFDERDSLDSYGMRTAARLEKAGALDEGDLLAHGVHLDASEVHTVRASGAWIAHNPRSNMNNGVGHAPVLDLGERVALGTDGIDSDMLAEARACYLRAREASLEVGPGFATERLAAGAAVVGSLFGEPSLGTLGTGAPADLVVLDYRSPTPLEAANLAGHLVFGVRSAAVRDVMVAGRWIVRDRTHQLIDEDALAARCREAAPKLWAAMEDL